MTQVGVVAAILVGATAGAGDRGAGVFRELVVTGRPRLALFAARIPGGLIFLLAFVAVAFAIAAAAAVALTGDDQSPVAGRTIAETAGWVGLGTIVAYALALGVSSAFGSRGTAIGILLGWQLAAAPILLASGRLDALLPNAALLALEPRRGGATRHHVRLDRNRDPPLLDARTARSRRLANTSERRLGPIAGPIAVTLATGVGNPRLVTPSCVRARARERKWWEARSRGVLHISPKTVDATLARVYRKLGIHSRASSAPEWSRYRSRKTPDVRRRRRFYRVRREQRRQRTRRSRNVPRRALLDRGDPWTSSRTRPHACVVASRRSPGKTFGFGSYTDARPRRGDGLLRLRGGVGRGDRRRLRSLRGAVRAPRRRASSKRRRGSSATSHH